MTDLTDLTDLTVNGWADEEHYVLDSAKNEVVRKGRGDESEVRDLFGVGHLAKELFDKGLIGLVNQAVLHNYGYGIGVSVTEPDEDGNREVIGLALYKTDDADGIWFDEDMIKAWRGKMADAGLR